MKTVPLSEVEADLSGYLDLAATEEILITRNGKPAGVSTDPTNRQSIASRHANRS